MKLCSCSSADSLKMIRPESSGNLTPSTRSLRTPPPHQGRDTPLPLAQQAGTLLGMASVSSSSRTATPNPPLRAEVGVLQVNPFAYKVAQYPQVVSVPLTRPPNGVAVNNMGVTLPRTACDATPRSITPRPMRASAPQANERAPSQAAVERIPSQAAVAQTMPESPKHQLMEKRQTDAELRRAPGQDGQDFYGWFAKASESVLQSADALGQDVARLAHLVDNCEGQIAKLRDDLGGQQKQVDELCRNRKAVEEARSQEVAEREAILAKLGSIGREAEVMRLEHKQTLDEAMLSISTQRGDQQDEHKTGFEAVVASQQEEQRKAFEAALADIATQREDWRVSHTRELDQLEGLQLKLREDQERLQAMSQSVVESLGGMRDELLAIRSEQEAAIKREACAMAEALRKEQKEVIQDQAQDMQAAVCKEILTEREDAIKSQASTIGKILRQELEEVIRSKADAMRATVCKDVEALQTQLSASQVNERRGKAAASPEQLAALEQAVCEELQLIKKENNMLAKQLREFSEDRLRQAQMEVAEAGPSAEEKLEGPHLDPEKTDNFFEEFALQLTELTKGVDDIRTYLTANNLEQHTALLNAESEARLALKESVDAQCSAHMQICAELRSDMKASLERIGLLEISSRGDQGAVARGCQDREQEGNLCECPPAPAQVGARTVLEAGSLRLPVDNELQSIVQFQDKFNEFSKVVWERLLDLGSTQDALIRQTSEIARLDKDVEAALGRLKQLDAGHGVAQLHKELAEVRADLQSMRTCTSGSLEAPKATTQRGCRRSLALEISQAESTPEPMSSKAEASEEHPELQQAIAILQKSFDPLAQELNESSTLVLERMNRLETTQDAHAVLLQTRDASQLDTQIQTLRRRLGQLESAHKEQNATVELCDSVHPELADIRGRLASAESTLREAGSQVAQLSQDVELVREDGSAVSKQANGLRKELNSLVERLTRLEFTVAEGATSFQHEQHLQIVRALHVDVQAILKRLSRLEQLSSDLGADHSQNLQATSDLRMQVERALDRIARVESATGEPLSGFNQSLVSFGSAPTSPAQACRSPERGEVRFSFSQLRSELDAVLGRLAYSEATAEEDRSWRERTTKGIQRMEQSLGEHGDAIRAVSEAFEALCSTKAIGPNPETLPMEIKDSEAF